jgi:hypothetical protein
MSNEHCCHGKIRSYAPWHAVAQIPIPEGESETSCIVYDS